MKIYLFRFCSCLVGLMIGLWLLNITVSLPEGILCTVMLTLMYLLLRPLMQLIILPLNMFLAGILSVAADALLVCWAAAWTPGLSLSYLQALLCAGLIALCFLPYVLYRGKKQIAS